MIGDTKSEIRNPKSEILPRTQIRNSSLRYYGGSGNRGAHAGAYGTYWNIRASSPMPLPAADFGPLLNFIGVNSNAEDNNSPYRWTLEQVGSAKLCPADLHQAMRARRVGYVKR